MSREENRMLWNELNVMVVKDAALRSVMQAANSAPEMGDEEMLLHMVIHQAHRIQEAEKALKSNFADYLKPFQYKGAR